jgi:hypothetical protein
LEPVSEFFFAGCLEFLEGVARSGDFEGWYATVCGVRDNIFVSNQWIGRVVFIWERVWRAREDVGRVDMRQAGRDV